MIDVYQGQVRHVRFHEIILSFAVVIYVQHGHKEPSKYDTETKEQLNGHRLLCNSGSTNFILPRPVKVWYHKRELQEQ